MKCPECINLKLKSKVFELNSVATLAHCPPYYDVDGNRHIHDSNYSTDNYECTNGHRWSIVSKKECWCGWPNNVKNNDL